MKEIGEYWVTKYRPLIEKRIEHRIKKEFKEADEIRSQLLEEGILIVEDGVSVFSRWGPSESSIECTWLNG